MGFMLQSQTIKIINVDNKIQTEKEMRKHGNMLPIFIRDIICGPSNCGKINVLISLLESLQDASPNPDTFQFKFSAILCLRQRLLLTSEKFFCF